MKAKADQLVETIVLGRKLIAAIAELEALKAELVDNLKEIHELRATIAQQKADPTKQNIGGEKE